MYDLWNYILSDKWFEKLRSLKNYSLLIMHTFSEIMISICYVAKIFWYGSNLCSQPDYVSVGPTNEDYTLVISESHQWGLYVGTQ